MTEMGSDLRPSGPEMGAVAASEWMEFEKGGRVHERARSKSLFCKRLRQGL